MEEAQNFFPASSCVQEVIELDTCDGSSMYIKERGMQFYRSVIQLRLLSRMPYNPVLWSHTHSFLQTTEMSTRVLHSLSNLRGCQVLPIKILVSCAVAWICSKALQKEGVPHVTKENSGTHKGLIWFGFVLGSAYVVLVCTTFRSNRIRVGTRLFILIVW